MNMARARPDGLRLRVKTSQRATCCPVAAGGLLARCCEKSRLAGRRSKRKESELAEWRLAGRLGLLAYAQANEAHSG